MVHMSAIPCMLRSIILLYSALMRRVVIIILYIIIVTTIIFFLAKEKNHKIEGISMHCIVILKMQGLIKAVLGLYHLPLAGFNLKFAIHASCGHEDA